MDDMKDKSIHLTVEKLSEEIQNMKIYKDFYTDLQVSSLVILLNYWTKYMRPIFVLQHRIPWPNFFT